MSSKVPISPTHHKIRQPANHHEPPQRLRFSSTDRTSAGIRTPHIHFQHIKTMPCIAYALCVALARSSYGGLARQPLVGRSEVR
ncbi:hypothetical protein [Vibrio ruber]|uniref:hypothetical protein n=1 Tax=Vibrio ruber TaxID=184755 RepID=UPI001115A348|nr:hypothetical protein [Vibrio ruber]